MIVHRRVSWTMMAVSLGILAGCASPAPMMGTPESLGNGSVAAYAEVDSAGAPQVVGVMFEASALNRLATGPSDGPRCFTASRDGKIDLAKDCAATYEHVLPLPSDLARRADMPFKWVLLNWNPHGHIPPGVYDTPHFDVHFVIEPVENIFAIQTGPCGPEHVRCDQFGVGRKPPPANYVPASHIDVGAVVPAMGNHFVDINGPEFNGEKFKRAFIFGVYDGRVTFYEEMVDRAWLLSNPSNCFPIPSPEAVAVSGYYPTQTCIRYVANKNAYTVSLEGFAMRSASPPASPRPVPPVPPASPPSHA
jgi:hypothetical protein